MSGDGATSDALAGNPMMYEGPFPLYDAVKAEHVVPAIRELIRQSTAEFERLEASMQELGERVKAQDLLPAFERLGDRLGRSWGVARHLKKVKDTPELRKAIEEVEPEKVAYGMKVAQSQHLYGAFKAIRNGADWASLSEAQQRIVEAEIRDAELAGVSLVGEAKERYTALQQEAAKLSTKFSSNLLDATKAFAHVVTDKAEVDGLPESALAQAAEAAKSRGHPDATAEAGPWALCLDFAAFQPVMQYAKNRELREKLYRAYITRASELEEAEAGAERDNTPLIAQILKVRKEKVKLLGLKSYAEYSTASKMATVDAALGLLNDMKARCYEKAKQELEELTAFARSQGFEGELQPWDTNFYAEALKKDRYAFSQEDLRPYFSLERVLQGLFALAERLFGINIVKSGNPPPTWHPDVSCWEIHRDGQPVAYFYIDAYSRPGEKDGGAWFSDVVGRSKALAPEGQPFRLPVGNIVCNQTPPVGGKPSLMTLREVETMFHEFGHSLQHMLTTQEEGLVAGISGIEWDAVEEPSQFMENWCYDKATIDRIAVHWETGELIPAELWAKVMAAKNYRMASQYLRQLHFGIVDLTLHSTYDPEAGPSVHELNLQIAKDLLVQQPLPTDRFLASFSHIFAGGYAAGYFSYLWAEVLSADCFSAFEEAGLDNEEAVKATGRRFRDTVLGLGGGVAPGKVFELFRGRPPKPDALLRHAGLVG